jgi:hypothetical protein
MIEADRILEGLAHTLEETVLPALGGGYARGQLYAVLEVIGGLQGQLQWGGMLSENEASTLAALAVEAASTLEGPLKEHASSVAARTAAPLADRLREGRALVCALIDAGYADAAPAGAMHAAPAGAMHAETGALAASINGYLANDAISRAMALRPSRLAEISQG